MNWQHSIYGSRSLTKDFSIGFLTIIILISALVFSSSGLMFLKIEGSKFQEEAHDIFQDFKNIIAAPLWHFDDAEIASICKTFLSGRAVSKIVIFSNDGKEVYSFGNVEKKTRKFCSSLTTCCIKPDGSERLNFIPKKPNILNRPNIIFTQAYPQFS